MKHFLAREWQWFWNRCMWSWQGVVAMWKNEPSFKVWVGLNVCSITMAMWLPLSGEGRALIVALGLFVLVIEALNTAIEAAVDHTSTKHNPLAKLAKDTASAGVALAAIAVGLAWVILICDLI